MTDEFALCDSTSCQRSFHCSAARELVWYLIVDVLKLEAMR
jgi:hypothetical protein